MLTFTPGPTDVPPRVLRRLSRPMPNPDLDQGFLRLYEGVQGKLKSLMKTKNDVLVMSGEGYLGLEAAVASLVRRGSKVLTITNGVFGDGFIDLVRLYGGIPVVARSPYDRPVDPEKVKEALDNHRGVAVATFVHCETPSGVMNPLKEIAAACRKSGVMLVADVVSSLGGVPVETDRWGVEVALGASQKCLSAPPGIAFLSVGDEAWEAVRSRGDTVPAYYASLWQWDQWWKKRLFPYTPAANDINALDEALDIVLEEGLPAGLRRHAEVSRAILTACRAMGLHPYPADDSFHAPTVTAIRMPPEITEERLLGRMRERYGVVIAGSWGELSGKVFRLGNMGYNAQPGKALRALRALEGSLTDIGFAPVESGVAAAKSMLSG